MKTRNSCNTFKTLFLPSLEFVHSFCISCAFAIRHQLTFLFMKITNYQQWSFDKWEVINYHHVKIPWHVNEYSASSSAIWNCYFVAHVILRIFKVISIACTIRLLARGRKILRRLNVLIEAESRVLFPRQTEAVETLQKKGQQSFS